MPLQGKKHRTRIELWLCLLLGVVLSACGDGDGPGFIAAAPGPTPGPTPSTYAVTALVSDGAVPAATTDRNLINPWGIVFAPGSAVWVANNGTSTATLYDGSGVQQPQVISLPGGSNGPADPTGVVFNSTPDFVVTNGVSALAATFIAAGEAGTLIGWAPMIDPTDGLIAYDDGSGGAVYKGLAIAAADGANFLYATDFHNNKIDVFDGNFQKVTVPGGFLDESLPSGYAPFGIQAVERGGDTVLFVTYAQRAADSDDNVNGAGLGLVNMFDTSGTLLTHFVPIGGHLNAPWGVALAPGTFGSLSNTVLIGNFGDGVITAYDADTGEFIDSIKDPAGLPIARPGLWGIAFGNGAHNQPMSTLFFAAGIANEADGVYGRIDGVGGDSTAAAPDDASSGSTDSSMSGGSQGQAFSSGPGNRTDTIPPTVQIPIPGPNSIVSDIITLFTIVTDNVGVTSVEFFVGANSIGVVSSPPFAIDWDSTTVGNGSTTISAVAKDAAGNLTKSDAVVISVSNVPRPTR